MTTQTSTRSIELLKKLSFVLFIYTLLVILWGAWVRISHSGDGCGDTWPLCGGKLIPEAERKTWIEYSHRLMSGIYGIYVFILFLLAKKWLQGAYKKYQLYFTLSLIFTVTEALLGAKLVLFGLVGQNSSLYRLFVMSLHQLNSMILSAVVFLSFYTLYRLQKFSNTESHLFKIKTYRVAGVFLLLAVSGALAALASTLFPSESLLEGILKDFSSDSHIFTRLRILHPLIAFGLGAVLIYTFSKHSKSKTGSFIEDVKKDFSLQTLCVFITALILGGITLVTLSPVPLKIVHLLMAHLTWAFILRWCIRNQDEQAHAQSLV